jgi:hypothetical protein
MSGKRIKGMVRVEGLTYRIERLESGFYEVIRLADEAKVGRFEIAETMRLEPNSIEESLLRRIAREALRLGKTSWVFHETPSQPPVAPNEPESKDEGAPITPRRLAPA